MEGQHSTAHHEFTLNSDTAFVAPFRSSGHTCPLCHVIVACLSSFTSTTVTSTGYCNPRQRHGRRARQVTCCAAARCVKRRVGGVVGGNMARGTPFAPVFRRPTALPCCCRHARSIMPRPLTATANVRLPQSLAAGRCAVVLYVNSTPRMSHRHIAIRQRISVLPAKVIAATSRYGGWARIPRRVGSRAWGGGGGGNAHLVMRTDDGNSLENPRCSLRHPYFRQRTVATPALRTFVVRECTPV